MEIIREGRHFRLVEESELPQIMNHLEWFFPESIKFHQTIQTYLNDRVWEFKFYVSKEWPQKPIALHFPGCTLTPNNDIYQSFGIFCPSGEIELVDMMKTEDILINWKKQIYLNFTHIEIINRLDSFYKEIGTMERLEGDIYVCNYLNKDLKLEELPDSAYMRQLTVEDVKNIHDLYPANEIESIDVFEILVKILPGLGIFRKDTNELAAWMVHSYYGAMFSMQTRPDYRRLGYGIRLATALTKKVIERGYKPFVVIRPKNFASRNLYTKLGFKKEFETCRVKMTPHSIKTNGETESLAPEIKTDTNLDNKENQPTDERSIDDMLNQKCNIKSNGDDDEAIGEDKNPSTVEVICDNK